MDQIPVERHQRREASAPLCEVLGIPALTISRISVREGVLRLAECDPMTGVRLRSSKVIRGRYACTLTGELVLVSAKKHGRITEGGKCRVNGLVARNDERAHKRALIDCDYVRLKVDHHNRLAHLEILADGRGPRCANFMEWTIG